MVRLSLFVAAVFSFSLLSAQDDDTIQFKQGLPITVEDSSEYDNVYSRYPPPDFRAVTADQLPEPLRETLDGDGLYKGWRDARVFFDVESKLYWVDFLLDEKVRRYGFSADGAPVSVKEFDIDQ